LVSACSCSFFYSQINIVQNALFYNTMNNDKNVPAWMRCDLCNTGTNLTVQGCGHIVCLPCATQFYSASHKANVHTTDDVRYIYETLKLVPVSCNVGTCQTSPQNPSCTLHYYSLSSVWENCYLHNSKIVRISSPHDILVCDKCQSQPDRPVSSTSKTVSLLYEEVLEPIKKKKQLLSFTTANAYDPASSDNYEIITASLKSCQLYEDDPVIVKKLQAYLDQLTRTVEVHDLATKKEMRLWSLILTSLKSYTSNMKWVNPWKIQTRGSLLKGTRDILVSSLLDYFSDETKNNFQRGVKYMPKCYVLYGIHIWNMHSEIVFGLTPLSRTLAGGNRTCIYDGSLFAKTFVQFEASRDQHFVNGVIVAFFQNGIIWNYERPTQILIGYVALTKKIIAYYRDVVSVSMPIKDMVDTFAFITLDMKLHIQEGIQEHIAHELTEAVDLSALFLYSQDLWFPFMVAKTPTSLNLMAILSSIVFTRKVLKSNDGYSVNKSLSAVKWTSDDDFIMDDSIQKTIVENTSFAMLHGPRYIQSSTKLHMANFIATRCVQLGYPLMYHIASSANHFVTGIYTSAVFSLVYFKNRTIGLLYSSAKWEKGEYTKFEINHICTVSALGYRPEKYIYELYSIMLHDIAYITLTVSSLEDVDDINYHHYICVIGNEPTTNEMPFIFHQKQIEYLTFPA
jgi:hypothetical protein